MEQQTKRIRFSAVVNNVVYRISSYRSTISEKEQVEQKIHNHFDIEFQYVFDGDEQIVTFQEQTPTQHTVAKGEMAVIPQGMFHGIHSSAVERFCFSINIEYREDTEYRELCRIRELYESIGGLKILRDPYIDNVMQQWRAFLQGKGRFSKAVQGFSLMSVAFRAFDLLTPPREGGGSNEEAGNEALMLKRKWMIEEYISDRYTSSAGLAELAKMLYLSERQTGTVVKELMGCDYKTLVVQRRMQLAVLLLHDPKNSLEEIAEAVGYSSYSGFYLAYIKYYGISPKEARKQFLAE